MQRLVQIKHDIAGQLRGLLGDSNRIEQFTFKRSHNFLNESDFLIRMPREFFHVPEHVR